MSNILSIATVTATLRNVLTRVAVAIDSDPDNDLSDTQVTTVPPEKAGTTDDHNQINVFLYHVQPNAAARNLDERGFPGRPPVLSLDLYYLVTVYGRNSNELLSQRLLGSAMSLLHSNPVLATTDIAAALTGTNLQNQPGCVRVIPHTMQNEEMVRLWSTFQVKYRLSAAYRVALVMLDNAVQQTDAAAVQKVQIGISPQVTTSSSGAPT